MNEFFALSWKVGGLESGIASNFLELILLYLL